MSLIPLISVVSPVYGCEKCLLRLYENIKYELEKQSANFELILVNDNSPDNSWEIISVLCKLDKRVKGINLSRNFGQHYAIAAGLEICTGEWIVVMDCDLQDQPEEILKLFQKAQEGYDIVLAKRFIRNDNFIKRLFSKLFYILLSYLTNTEQNSQVANFGIYHRKVVRAICSMNDSIRYFPAMVRWVGFRTTSINVMHGKRDVGKTAYNFKKLTNLALDVIFAFSDKPLRITVKLGISVSLMSILFAMWSLYKYFNHQIEVTGWTSLIISIWFLSGLIIFVLGIVGLYIGKTFERVKNRPVYIIKDVLNVENYNG